MFKIMTGEKLDIPITLTNADGTPVDITGCTITVTLRKTKTDVGTPAITKTATIVDAEEGEASFHLSETDTAITPDTYYVEAKVLFTNGNIRKTLYGSIVIEQALTE